jgi:hypothetical protein
MAHGKKPVNVAQKAFAICSKNNSIQPLRETL